MYHFIRVKSSSFAALRLHQLNIKYGELTANERMPRVRLFKGWHYAVHTPSVTTTGT